MNLQLEWDQAVTPAMERRGRLIRADIPRWLREQAGSWDHSGRFHVEGSDGKGLKAVTPWVRVYEPRRSPSATIGWYVVYLFSADGGHLYLSLIQGTTTGDGRRALDEVRGRAQWARTLLAEQLALREDLTGSIDLRSTKWRPRSYENGTVAAFEYRRDELPDDQTLVADLAFLVHTLDALPTLVNPEVADAMAAAEESAGRRRRFGRRMTAAERLAIEQRAVTVATTYLVGEGYTVVDVGATESYDLDARRGGERLFVEVKGTTSDGTEVVLTKAEVDLHLREYPNTMLALVTGVLLDRTGPSATGGALRTLHPWVIDRDRLDPLAFRYAVPH